MADFVTLKFVEEATAQGIVAGLASTDPVAKLVTGGKLYLPELGSRATQGLPAQGLYMEHWDGASGVVEVVDILNRVPAALEANKGRVKFMLTDQVRASLERGMIARLLDLGLLVNEGFASYS